MGLARARGVDQEPLPSLTHATNVNEAQERPLDPSNASSSSGKQGQTAAKRQRWRRREACRRRAVAGRQPRLSQRQRAARSGVPRSTLRKWELREREAQGDPVAAFFETEEGVEVLRRILLAAAFVNSALGPNGIRGVCTFLELSGLSRYAASSYGAVRPLVQQMTADIVKFGKAERARLAAAMAERGITLAVDEMFPPGQGACLVAIEPVSNFIVAEECAPSRDAVQWAATLGKATRDLKVRIEQLVSDEAGAFELLATASAVKHRGPDVFHVQYELTKTCSAPLAAKVRKAVDATADDPAVAADDESGDADEARDSGIAPALNEPEQPRSAEAGEPVAPTALSEAMGLQGAMGAVVRGIGAAYHPFDLKTGATRCAKTVEAALDQLFQGARDVVVNAKLPDRCAKAVEKAARVTCAMVATIAFVHREVAERVAGLAYGDDVKDLIRSLLIPALYLARVAGKAATADERTQLAALARSLRERFDASTPWSGFDDAARAHIVKVALGCAELFQRSTSCVEGRNGYLRLFQHGLHALQPLKLEALTVIHNYFVTRYDEKTGTRTTAAERFFGHAPNDLFDWLLARYDGPPRPAASRPRKHRPNTASGDIAVTLAVSSK